MKRSKKGSGKTSAHNPIVFETYDNIGLYSAEFDDEYLSKCYFDHPALKEFENLSSPRMIALGRTGSGKTAILRKLLETKKNACEIELSSISLDYIANSNIIKFLDTLDVDLDVFFKFLWKHILMVEYIRVSYRISDRNKSINFYTRFKTYLERFSGMRQKEKSVEYLNNWASKFWITMDESVVEVIKKLKTDVNVGLGTDLENFNTNAGYSRTLKKERRALLKEKARPIVNSDQISELNEIIKLLSDFPSDKFSDCYIIIDKIDEKWVDDSIRFRLIRALIETLKSFHGIENFKIIVAVRTDVLDRVIHETKDSGYQSEKYEDLILRLNWSTNQLFEMVQSRIKYLFSKKYTGDTVKFDEIFPPKVGQADTFDYIVERTLNRPRDIISFINFCINQSAKEREKEREKGMDDEKIKGVTVKHIKIAENEYSIEKHKALLEEWELTIPSLNTVLNLIRTLRLKERVSADYFLNETFFEAYITIMTDQVTKEYDPLQSACMRYINEKGEKYKVEAIKTLLVELYRIGIIGIKLNSSATIYSHKSSITLSNEMIDIEICSVHFNPMFHHSLNINL